MKDGERPRAVGVPMRHVIVFSPGKKTGRLTEKEAVEKTGLSAKACLNYASTFVLVEDAKMQSRKPSSHFFSGE